MAKQEVMPVVVDDEAEKKRKKEEEDREDNQELAFDAAETAINVELTNEALNGPNSPTLLDNCIKLTQKVRAYIKYFLESLSKVEAPNFKSQYLIDKVSNGLQQIKTAADSACRQLKSLAPEDRNIFESIKDTMKALQSAINPIFSGIKSTFESLKNACPDVKMPDLSGLGKAVGAIGTVASDLLGKVDLSDMSDMIFN